MFADKEKDIGKNKKLDHDRHYIYFLTANPPNTRPTKAQDVMQEIKEMVEQKVQRKGGKEVKFYPGAFATRWKDVMRNLRTFHQRKGKLPEVVHFLCHGNVDVTDEDQTKLAFEDGPVNSFQVAALFEGLSSVAKDYSCSGVKCVIFSVCHSEEFGPALVDHYYSETGIEATIASQGSLNIIENKHYCANLYMAMCFGDSLQSSHEQAKIGCKRDGVGAPKLLLAMHEEDSPLLLFPSS